MVRRATIAGGVILGACAALVSVARCDAFKDDVHFSQQWLGSNPGIGNSTEERRADQSLFGRIRERWFNIDVASVNAQYSLEFALAKQGRFEASIVTFHFWAGHLEIFKAEGMHYAILDLEHGSASLPMVEDLRRVARLIDFPLIIRPESSVYHLVRKYIDMTAAGLMIPWTER